MSIPLLLFVSKDSLYFKVSIEAFRKLQENLINLDSFSFDIIDISKQPEKAEEYKINALPTLIVGTKQFIGKLDINTIIPYIQSLQYDK
ncbi:MAG: circadian clock KaiB family protein [Rhabdochlamydiaceae bacterium]|nr:circadian clock KaiB family protein [Candidatus Amphrikana amoebophyrae]